MCLKIENNLSCFWVQEEYEAGDELGRLNCEHSYHFQCIKQWVAQKNFCPVCKQQVAARHWVTQPFCFFGQLPFSSINLCIVFHIQYKQEFSFSAVNHHFMFQNSCILCEKSAIICYWVKVFYSGWDLCILYARFVLPKSSYFLFSFGFLMKLCLWHSRVFLFGMLVLNYTHFGSYGDKFLLAVATCYIYIM